MLNEQTLLEILIEQAKIYAPSSCSDLIDSGESCYQGISLDVTSLPTDSDGFRHSIFNKVIVSATVYDSYDNWHEELCEVQLGGIQRLMTEEEYREALKKALPKLEEKHLREQLENRMACFTYKLSIEQMRELIDKDSFIVKHNRFGGDSEVID